MERDDLQAVWRGGLSAAPLALAAAQAQRRAVRSTWASLILEGLVGVLTVGLTWAFLRRHGGVVRDAVAGGILLLAGLAALAAAMRQAALLRLVDPAGPVVEQQRRLEALRISRLLATRVGLVVGLPCWVAFPVVLARGLLGVDLLAAAGWPWLAANVLAGLLLVPGALWLTSGRSPARLRDHLTGRSLAEAREAAARIRRFEAGVEPPGLSPP